VDRALQSTTFFYDTFRHIAFFIYTIYDTIILSGGCGG